MSIQTHVAVTAVRNFLIWDMMLSYDVGLMPVVSKFDAGWYPRPDAQTKMSVAKKGPHVISIGNF